MNLTQTELGLLTGASDASAVSRHEGGQRLPDLQTAIAYHIVLSGRIEDLFPDLVEEITAEVAARAVELAAMLRRGPIDQRVAAVLRRLAEITGDETIEYGEDTLF
jgi:hypothetical protein